MKGINCNTCVSHLHVFEKVYSGVNQKHFVLFHYEKLPMQCTYMNFLVLRKKKKKVALEKRTGFIGPVSEINEIWIQERCRYPVTENAFLKHYKAFLVS